MVIPEGYKQTEVGIIPEDWEVKELHDAFSRLEAGVSVNSDDSFASDYFVLKTSAIRNGKVNTDEIKPVVREDYGRLKCSVQRGSIIISRMNTPAMVGECGYSEEEVSNVFLPDRLWQVLPSSSEYDFLWLNYLLNTNKYAMAIRATATGTSNSMKNISKERFLEIKIPKPPIHEQRRIAMCLSDFDKAIEATEKLLAKKKEIKQGAMQELLTGKRRLPGCEAEWCQHSLEAICFNITDGAHNSPVESSDGFYMPSVKDMTDHSFDFSLCKRISKADYEKLVRNGCNPQKGDVLIAKDGSILKHTFVFDGEQPIVILSSIAIIRPNRDKVYSEYLAQYFKQPSFIENAIANYKTGTGVPRIVLNNFKKIVIRMPSSVDEQREIASILFDMDIEISDLEEKVAKYRQLKQGMMQQLLTGKIRLK